MLIDQVDKLAKKNKAIPPPNPYSFDSWCNGNVFYEQSGTGDGVSIAYWDNEAFEGRPIKSTNINLDFDWSGKPPVKGISSENFSAK